MTANTLAIHQNLERPGHRMCARGILRGQAAYRTAPVQGDRSLGGKAKHGTLMGSSRNLIFIRTNPLMTSRMHGARVSFDKRQQ